MTKDNIMLGGNISKTSGLICVLALVFLTIPISFAEGIHIYREYPTAAKMGTVVQINITVENPGNLGTMATIQENVGDYTVIEPTPITPKGTPGMIGLRLPYFEWNITINPMQNKTVYYKVNLTSPGEIMLSPAVVIAGNETAYTEPGSINVICNQNGECEADIGENYLTCPEDCPTGAADGLCDLMKDGRCDPDCTEGTDIDCAQIENPASNQTPSGDETPPVNETPPETQPESFLETYWWAISTVAVLILLVIIYIFLKKRSKPKEESAWQAAYEEAPTNPPVNPNP